MIHEKIPKPAAGRQNGEHFEKNQRIFPSHRHLVVRGKPALALVMHDRCRYSPLKCQVFKSEVSVWDLMNSAMFCRFFINVASLSPYTGVFASTTS